MFSAGKESMGSLYGYDIIGYLIPGGTFLAFSYGLEKWTHSQIGSPNDPTDSYHTPVKSFIELFNRNFPDDILGGVIFALVLATTAYIVGQTISTLASLFIDRILVAKVHGYPFMHFVNYKPKEYGLCKKAKKDYKKGVLTSSQGGFWVAIFFSFFLYTMSQLYDNVYGLETSTIRILGAPLVFFSFLKLAHTYMTRNKWLYNKTVCNFLGSFGSLIKSFYLNNVNIVLYFFGGTTVPSKHNKKVFTDKFLARFNSSPERLGSNSFWMAYFYVKDYNKSSYTLLRYYLRQYTFARNMSLCFFMILLYIAFSQFGASIYLELGENSKPSILFSCIVILSLSYLFFIRYYYMYYNMFNRNLYRIFAFGASSEPVPTQLQPPAVEATTT